MATTYTTKFENSSTPLPRSLLSSRWVGALGSRKAAISLSVLLLIACIAATTLPQGDAAAAKFAQLPGAMMWFTAAGVLGFTHIFSSWWFIGLLFILASGVAVCTACRLTVARRATGAEARRAFGSALTHASLLLIMAGGVSRILWGETGHFTLSEGEQAARLNCVSGNRTLPFAVRLDRVQIEREAAPKAIAAATPVLGSAVRDIKTFVAVTVNGVTQPAVIAVNAPLVVNGYRIYHLSGAPAPRGAAVFQVVRDPGLPLVYAGFGLLLSSLIFALYLNPWMNTRRTNG